MFNLDDLTINPDELIATADALEKLAMYARHKANGILSRREGRVRTAENAERRADAVYVTLPEWAKW